MDVHLIDGTYELFRHFYALPSARDAETGQEVAAVRGVLRSVLGLITAGATHVGVATDHVIESFRNRLWRGYKTSAGVDAALLAQFQLLEDTFRTMGVVVWPMVEFEADDALAAAAAKAAADSRVTRVIICTPDKDLAQSVRGTRVVQLNRRTRQIMDEAGVVKKFGVHSGVNSRLPRARWRQRRRLSRPSRVGRQVRCGGARQIRTHRGHPGRLARLARERVQPLRAGRDPGARP